MNVKTVVIVNDFNYTQGGASKVAIDTARILKEQNIKTYFFSAVNKEEEKITGVEYITTKQKEALKEKNKIKGIINGIYNIKARKETITSEKIRMIKDAGIRRISVGIQSLYFSRWHSGIGWRYPEAQEIISRINEIRAAGGFKINLDFMYGFKHQDINEVDDFEKIALEELNPDQVTVYELRTNQLNDYEKSKPGDRSWFYDKWYRLLADMGYLGKYGQNTFSLDKHDYGVSSYIRHRMLDGSDYKGFGISAQSMSGGNVEYNAGKNAKDLLSLIPVGKIPKDASFEATEHYELPIEEKFAKFVCVSAYSGGFNWRIAKKRFYPDFFERFGPVIDFLTSRKELSESDIALSNDRIYVTKDGFRHYGPLFSLFYKPELLTTK